MGGGLRLTLMGANVCQPPRVTSNDRSALNIKTYESDSRALVVINRCSTTGREVTAQRITKTDHRTTCIFICTRKGVNLCNRRPPLTTYLHDIIIYSLSVPLGGALPQFTLSGPLYVRTECMATA